MGPASRSSAGTSIVAMTMLSPRRTAGSWAMTVIRRVGGRASAESSLTVFFFAMRPPPVVLFRRAHFRPGKPVRMVLLKRPSLQHPVLGKETEADGQRQTLGQDPVLIRLHEPALHGRERRRERELRCRIARIDAYRHQVEVVRPDFRI